MDSTAAGGRAGRLGPFESAPRFVAGAGNVKLSAAWLIERAGFPKGYLRGNAGISSRHNLALVNRGGATARDIIELMHLIQAGVEEKFEVRLEPEPTFVGF